MNPARTFGPSVVTCMGGGDCDDVIGDWYWIYYVGPLLAGWAVAEVTLVLQKGCGRRPCRYRGRESLAQNPRGRNFGNLEERCNS